MTPIPSWTPDAQTSQHSRIEAFRRWAEQNVTVDGDPLVVPDYPALQAWSARDPQFWVALWDFLDVAADHGDGPVLADAAMPGASWFPQVRLNYVNQVFGRSDIDLDAIAIIERAETATADGDSTPAERTLTYRELRRQVAALAHTLRTLGVREGDRVVGYLPNIAAAPIALLATASIGAIWSACGQDYAAPAAIDRLGQLEPSVLIAADGYRYGTKNHSRLGATAELAAGLPSLRRTILVPRLGGEAGPTADEIAAAGLADALPWDDAITSVPSPTPDLDVVDVAFDHPLWVLFSSGTTGKPKGIVHGHGGVVLEHVKQIALHSDLGPGDVFFWYTSPSWMMWNYQVAGLLVGATIVCYDGSPSHPTKDALWQLADELGVRLLGTSPAYLAACEQAALTPGRDHDLSRLQVLGSTGSVLPPAANAWVSNNVGEQVAVGGISGGTDVVSAFLGHCPTMPVWPGELSVICLGTALEAWTGQDRPVVGQMGELVITRPMPSMPLFFWNDPDGARYRDAYFGTYPGVWRHGDWITVTERGSVIVHGRSDSTLNRNGVRMGSADIYAAIEPMTQIEEALVIGVEHADGRYWMPLFVHLADGVELTPELRAEIETRIRTTASPKHVPDDVLVVSGIPHTRTGKKLEVPIKRILAGADPDAVADPQSIDNADLLTEFARLRR